MPDEIRFAMPPPIVFKKQDKQEVRFDPAKPGVGVSGAKISFNLERVTYPEWLLKEYQSEGKLRHKGNYWEDKDGTYYPHPEKYQSYNCTLAWFTDCPFPRKGFPFPQGILATNYAKRIFKEGMGIPLKWDKKIISVLGGAFLILPMSSKIRLVESFLESYNGMVENIISNYLPEERTYLPVAAEIRDFLIRFFSKVGINEEIGRKFANNFGMLIHNDDAYYLRIEDILSETTKEALLHDTQAEIKRLMDLLLAREPNGDLDSGNVGKFNNMARAIGFALKVPTFRDAFRHALQESKFENFQWDETDKHHTLLWDDYDFRGQKMEERQKEYVEYYTNHPPFPTRREIS